ncbi:hypothetical protein Tco_1131674 [Tanacetum coccineum]
MDANKKDDLEHVQCLPESKILTNIIKNHPLRFSIATSFSVPWIYMAQFWHTLKEDESKYRLTFMLDKKELSLILDDFRTIFHLPQANANNHDNFVPPPSFSDMVPFYKQQLGFAIELKTTSSFKINGLLQPWKTLCKIFSKCLTTRVTGWDQPPLQIMQMMYYFVNNIHVDYAELLWKGLYYSLHHPTSSISYPRFTKIIISHYMTNVPLTQSQPTESTQGTHRTPSAPRRSTRLIPPAPVPTIDKADEMILQDTLQMVEGSENVIDDSLLPRNDEPKIPGTRLEPRSDKESPEVKITNDKEVEITNDEEVEITNVVIPVNVNEEEEEITDEVHELKRREKGKIVEESRSTTFPTPIRSPRIHTDLVSSDTEKLQELTELQRCYTYLFEHLKARFMSRKSFDTLADHLQEVMVESLPIMVDTHIKEQVKKQVPKQMKFESLQDDPHDDAHPEGENRAKRQKTSEYEAYVSGESSSGQVNESEQDDDEIPMKQMSQDIMEEVSLTIDEAKLKKMVDEMLRQRCTSGDEHQYHIDQMKNFLKCDIVWESRKEILVSPHPRKTTPLVQSCQRDPEAPPLSLINQDLLYLKKGSSGPEKIVLSLYKFPAIIFNDDDIEEQTFRWIFYIRKQKESRKPKKVIYSNSKIIQVIKTYWELGHEHKFITEIVLRRANECTVSITKPDYKNLNKNDIEDMYLLIMNGKVPDYAETWLLWSLSVFIRSSVIWERVHDFQLGIKSYQQKVNLTTPTISFPEVKKHKMFSIIYEPVHRIIYKNSKKEKRVMRHSEIHKFCDATLNRVLEGLRSYNNDVKYGYIQRDLTNEEVEYLKIFEEEIEVRLKYRNQMRRWEMYGNGRPLGPRRERP